MAVTLVDLGRLRRVPRAPLRLRLARPAHRLPRARARSRSSSSSGSRFPRPTSHEALARRHLAPSRAGRAARARRARRASGGGARARARRATASASASRRATAPSSTSSATTPSALRSRRCERSAATRSRRCSTGSPTRRRRCISSASPPGSTRSCPGEGEILGQVRAAYEAGAPGPLLDRLFRQALHVGKQRAHGDRDRREPGVGLVRRARRSRSRCSATSTGRRVLLVGAGKIGELAAREPRLARRRDRARREPLRRARRGARARASAARRVPLERARGRARRRSTSSSRARARPASSLAARATSASGSGRPLFLIDIAVPRDLDPAIDELDGCYLYDIDDLEAVVARDARGPAARGGAGGGDRRRGGGALPRVAGLARRRAGDRVAARARRGDPLGGAREGRSLSERERAAVESVTAQILNKLLHLPTVRMKEAAAAADGVRLC